MAAVPVFLGGGTNRIDFESVISIRSCDGEGRFTWPVLFFVDAALELVCRVTGAELKKPKQSNWKVSKGQG